MRAMYLFIIIFVLVLVLTACTSQQSPSNNSFSSNQVNAYANTTIPERLVTLNPTAAAYSTCTTAADCASCEGCNNVTCKQLGELPSYCSECATHDDCKQGYACNFKENECVIAQRCDILDYLSGNNTCSAGFTCDNDVCVPSTP